VNSRNLRRKIRFWLWILRRKNQICWSEKSKFGFWEEEKSDFDLTFRFLRVKSWKNQISWSEKSKFEKKNPILTWLLERKVELGSEKKKSDLLEWKIEIWVLRRRKIRFWLGFSNSWSVKLKKSDFLEWKVEIWEEEIRFWLDSWSEKLNLGSEKKKSDFPEWEKPSKSTFSDSVL